MLYYILTIILICPLLHSLEQMLVHKPERARWPILRWKSKRFSALDGEHTTRWAMVGAYLLYSPAVLASVTAWLWPALLFLHWFIYNAGYHIGWDKYPDRALWECLPGWKLWRELYPLLFYRQ